MRTIFIFNILIITFIVCPSILCQECDNLHWNTNIAALGNATANDYLDENSPEQAIDGDLTTANNGWRPFNGEGWWQVELPCEQDIYKIEIFPNQENPNDMFRGYQIFASLTGEFDGEETILVDEKDWPFQLRVTYEFPPTSARFLRLVSVKPNSWALLQEFRAYPAVEPTPTPTVTLTPTISFFDIHGEPTSEEQELLEYVNRCRKDPVVEAHRLLNSNAYFAIIGGGYHPQEFIDEFARYYAQPPMSMNKKLILAARIHANDMAINRGDVYGHFGSNGSSPEDRVYGMAGYEGQGGGENVFDGVSSALNAHDGFIIDGGIGGMHGHRHAIINDNPNIALIVEAGISMVPIPSLWKEEQLIFSCVQEFGIPRDSIPRLCGVVYDDKNRNDRYDNGEGISNIKIQNKERWFQTLTSESGGYSLPLQKGTYNIEFLLENSVIQSFNNIVITDRNVKLDLPLHLNPTQTPTISPTLPTLNSNVNLAIGRETRAIYQTFDSYGNWDMSSNTEIIVNGDISTIGEHWSIGNINYGNCFIDIKLDKPFEINRIEIYPPAKNPNDLFSSFRVLTSLSGNFDVDGKEIILDDNWKDEQLPKISRRRSNGQFLPVTYTFDPFVAQYFRIQKLTGKYWEGIQEIMIYPPDKKIGITPSPIQATNTPTTKPTFTPTKTPTYTKTPTPTRPLPGHECDDLHYDTNIAPLGIASSSNWELMNATNAIDHNVDLLDPGWWSKEGFDWWQVELPCEIPIYKVELFPSVPNPFHMYPVFDIAVSNTGAFNGEEKIIVHEDIWKGLIPTIYDFDPEIAKFIRIIPHEKQPFTVIREFRVFPAVEQTPIRHECDDLHYYTNIASFGYATALCYRGGFEPIKAIDNDITSANNGWSNRFNSDIQKMPWWQVKLPCSIPIYKIEILTDPENTNEMYPSFKICGSMTGEFKGEEVILVIEELWPNIQMKTYDFQPVNTKYLRLIPLLENDWVTLREFRAYPAVEPTPTPTLTPTPTSRFSGEECIDITSSTNIASLGYATANQYLIDNEPGQAIDGDYALADNGWRPFNGEGWWQVELPCEREIYKIEIYPNQENPFDMFPAFQIFASLTGNFIGEEILLVDEKKWPIQSLVTYEFPPIPARFLRLVSIESHPWALLQEFRAYPYIHQETWIDLWEQY